MILIVRSNSITRDSRVGKYIQFLKKNSMDYFLLGWDRNHEKIKIDHGILYDKKAGYNVGGMKAVWFRLLWMYFVVKNLVKEKPDLIHACDLDATFPAVMYKLFFNKKVKIIFDIFDWYSATLANQSRYILYVFKLLEYISVKYSDYLFVCEEERLQQIPYDIESRVFILPNIPTGIDEQEIKYVDEQCAFNENKVTLSYVGGLYEERFLSELLDLAENDKINLLIAGYGDKNLEDRCRKLSSKENVKFYGPVDYRYGLHIMYNSDVIYAMYCKTNLNHIYAAPNKYYEAMLLSKPLITTEGTIVGDKVKKNDFGFVINENVTELDNLITYLSSHNKEFINKGNKAYILWQECYRDYVEHFLNTTYRKLCEDI